MAVQTLETLKSYFKAGKFPTQSNYDDLIDTVFSLIQQNTGNFLQVDVPNYTDAKVGDIVQHVGETTYDATHGYVYKCIVAQKSGDDYLQFTKTNNTLGSNLPSDGDYYKTKELTVESLINYKRYNARYYGIYAVTASNSGGTNINPTSQQVSEHFIAINPDTGDTMTVIKLFNGNYYRRTGVSNTSSGATIDTWQELPHSQSDYDNFRWERIDVQPNQGMVKTIALQSCDGYSYSYFSGNSKYEYSNIARSPFTPIPITDLVKFAGLLNVMNSDSDPAFTEGSVNSAILVVHNSGWNSNAGGDSTMYVSWHAYGDDWYGDQDTRYEGTQIASIPFGCSIAFNCVSPSYDGVGIWLPVGTYTPITAAELQAKEDDYLGN
jgi:hypothetical protein